MCAITGWIKLYRKMLDDHLFSGEKYDRFHAWVFLLVSAVYKDCTLRFGGSIVSLSAGQYVCTVSGLAKQWGWDRRTVLSFLTRLSEDGRIAFEIVKTHTIITIIDYGEEYAVDVQPNVQPFAQVDVQPFVQPNSNENQRVITKRKQDDVQPFVQPDAQPCAQLKKNIKNYVTKVTSEKLSKDNSRFYTHTHVCASAGTHEENFSDKEEQPATHTPLTKPKRKTTTKAPSLITKCREVFETAYEERYGSAYYWEAKDAASMKKLIKKIEFNRKSRGQPLDEVSLVEAFRLFIEAINKDWIFNNFSVPKINSQYNDIIAEIKNRRYATKQNNTANSQTTKEWFVGQANTLVHDLAALDAECERQQASSGVTLPIPQAVGSSC